MTSSDPDMVPMDEYADMDNSEAGNGDIIQASPQRVSGEGLVINDG